MNNTTSLSDTKPFRVAIFAAYDGKGIIHNYVLAYLHKLATVCDKIIFIADNPTTAQQKAKLSGLVEYMQFSRHGEYDFGSYKRGFNWLQKQPWFAAVDELILCNDSCFTVGPIAPMFTHMAAAKCDFWGMSQNTDHQRHLQSFFLVFKRPVFTAPAFADFLNAVQHEEEFMTVVLKYEVAFTKFLEDADFSSDAYIKDIFSPHQYPLTTLRRRMPLIKKKIFIDPAYSVESIGSLFKEIKKVSPQDYKNIICYFNMHPLLMVLTPLLITAQTSFKRCAIGFVRFFFQRKLTQNGYLLIKICKIPVYHRKEQV